MIKSKILYGLCIAALGLPFAEASKEMPNRDGGSDRSRQRSFDKQNPDHNYGSNKPVRQPQNEGENFVTESKKRVRNDGRLNNPNAMRKNQDSVEYRNMNGNPGLNQYNPNNNPNMIRNNNMMTNGFVNGNGGVAHGNNFGMNRPNNQPVNVALNKNGGVITGYRQAPQQNLLQQQWNGFVRRNFNNNHNMAINNNQIMNRSGNGNGGMFPGRMQVLQQNPFQQRGSGFVQCNFNNNLNMTINNNQMTNEVVSNNSSYGKYEGSYCDLMPKLPGVFVNGNLHSGDEIEIIACVLNLVSTDYECTASILNRLAESKLKSLEFLNGKKYSESIIQNITRTVGRQNTYGLLNYTKNGDNKLQMIKGITDGSSLADDIISMKCDFVSKLKEDDIGILKECVNKNSIKINVANEVDIRYETSRIYWPAERKKIKDYLRDLKLSGDARKKALKVIFYNDFYKIDELSYLTLKEKDAVKNKLLELTITWQEAAKFLHHEKLFELGYRSYLFNCDETAKIVNEVFKVKLEDNWQGVSGQKVQDSLRGAVINRIELEDIVLDLASLGLLKEIVSYIDDNKIKKFKDKFKSWIGGMQDGDEKNAFIKKLGGYDLGILGECVGEDENNNGKDEMEMENINRNLNDKDDKEDGMEMEDSETELDEGYATRTNGKKKVIEIEDDETEEDFETEDMEMK